MEDTRYCPHCGKQYDFSLEDCVYDVEPGADLLLYTFTCGYCKKEDTMVSPVSDYELNILDVCLSDYFSGSSKPVMAVSVHKGMTRFQFIEAMEDSHDHEYDHLVYGGWLHLTDTEFNFLATQLVSELKPGLFAYLEEETEDSESVYAYIGLSKK